MGIHSPIEAEANLHPDPAPTPHTDRTSRLSSIEDYAPFRTPPEAPEVAPIAFIPSALANRRTHPHTHRIMTREQGRALEMIGHAADYLNDCYLFQGADDEIINPAGAFPDAIRILTVARLQILDSLPTREPRTMRLWKVLFHRRSKEQPGTQSDRKDRSKPASVLPLSSSRE